MEERMKKFSLSLFLFLSFLFKLVTAKLGVCVTCATDDIKELAQYVTEVDYDQGAVKEVIEKFVLEAE